jgi:hypothetical protein
MVWCPKPATNNEPSREWRQFSSASGQYLAPISRAETFQPSWVNTINRPALLEAQRELLLLCLAARTTTIRWSSRVRDTSRVSRATRVFGAIDADSGDALLAGAATFRGLKWR